MPLWETALRAALCLSVRPPRRFTRNLRAVEPSNLTDLRFKGQRSRSMGTKM